MKLSHKKFDTLFALLSRLFWTVTLCLSLYVLTYAADMNVSPLDIFRTEDTVIQMTEAVILCGAIQGHTARSALAEPSTRFC